MKGKRFDLESLMYKTENFEMFEDMHNDECYIEGIDDPFTLPNYNPDNTDVAFYNEIKERIVVNPLYPHKRRAGRIKSRSNKKYQTWRQRVLKKYGGKCAKCNSKATHCHHIKNYSSNPQLKYNINNGILLCKSCHKEFHKKYWTRNNTKKQLKEFGVVL